MVIAAMVTDDEKPIASALQGRKARFQGYDVRVLSVGAEGLEPPTFAL